MVAPERSQCQSGWGFPRQSFSQSGWKGLLIKRVGYQQKQ